MFVAAGVPARTAARSIVGLLGAALSAGWRLLNDVPLEELVVRDGWHFVHLDGAIFAFLDPVLSSPVIVRFGLVETAIQVLLVFTSNILLDNHHFQPGPRNVSYCLLCFGFPFSLVFFFFLSESDSELADEEETDAFLFFSSTSANTG